MTAPFFLKNKWASQAARTAARQQDEEGHVRPAALVARGNGKSPVVGLRAARRAHELAQLDPARAVLLHPE